MNTRSIQSSAPTRIDLAGGTVDLWPLYLFLKNPITINLGINLFAEARIDDTDRTSSPAEGEICLTSIDQNVELKFSWHQLEQGIEPPPTLALHYHLLKFFTEKRKESKRSSNDPGHSHFVLKTRARSPAGAGLGGSSALSIALIGALATWAGFEVDPSQNGTELIEIVRDIETTVIQVPAGLQDYYGAMYGGLQCLHWKTGSHLRSPFDPQCMQELEKRLLLFYSGQSRNSGINNWALFKSFIDQDRSVRSQFEKIVRATHHLKEALEKGQWNQVGEAISEEWETRKNLAPGITTPAIELAFEEARQLTPLAGKVCGAGGGGCFFVYLPEVETKMRSSIQDVFVRHGMRPLDFKPTQGGLQVTST